MSEFILLFSCSFVLKVSLDLFFDLLMMRDAAKLGYKFKLDGITDECMEDDGNKKSNSSLKLDKLISLIPIVNAFISLMNGVKYMANKESYLRTFLKLDALENLNVLEDDVFLEKPTMVTAYKINKDMIEIPFCRYKETGRIYYYIDANDICYIIKVENEARELTLFEQREYVINRDSHKCQWCKGRNGDHILVTRPIMEVPFIYPEYYHSTNNTITLCKTCNNHINESQRKYEEMKSIGKRPRGRNYKSIISALSNILSQNSKKPLVGRMRMKVYEKLLNLYPNVEKVEGYVIKQIRINKGLKNSPINNARIMTRQPSKTLEKYYYVKLRRNHNRQLQRVTPLKNVGIRSSKSPYYTKGFASYDLVEFNGKEYYITKKRKSGYFSLGLADGTTLINSVKWDRIKLLQRRKSYSVETLLC